MSTDTLSSTRRRFVRVLVLGGAAAALTATPAVAAPEDEYDGGTP